MKDNFFSPVQVPKNPWSKPIFLSDAYETPLSPMTFLDLEDPHNEGFVRACWYFSFLEFVLSLP